MLYSRRRRQTRHGAGDCLSRCTRLNHAVNVHNQETWKARRSRSAERADKATSPLRLRRHTTEHQHKILTHLWPPILSHTRYTSSRRLTTMIGTHNINKHRKYTRAERIYHGTTFDSPRRYFFFIVLNVVPHAWFWFEVIGSRAAGDLNLVALYL